MAAAKTVEIETPHGPARAHLHRVPKARAALVLGHGAGGGVSAPDLVAVTRAANGAGFTVVLVEQPYRVAGRRSSPPAAQLDTAWIAVLERLAKRELNGLRLVTGGRSAGARVACRTAAGTGAIGVLCLAFPLVPPRRTGPPPPSRLPELDAVKVPVLVIQGRSDPFGMPPRGRRRKVVEVDGTHGLKSDPAAGGGAGGAGGGRRGARPGVGQLVVVVRD
jgi:predicted alpha/beta-hydrolase family hydrolase